MGRRKRSRSRTPKKSRSRSRSGGRDRKQRKHRRHERSKRKERSSSSSRSPSPDGDRKTNRSQVSPSKHSDFSLKQSERVTTGNNDSLSIAETNALRAKIGLAPLDCDPVPEKKCENGNNQTILEDGVVWNPAPDITTDKQTEKLREKLAVLKEKREIDKKRFKNAPKLVENESDEDLDASSWVAKLKQAQEKKQKLETEEKQLETLGNEFGLDSIIEENLKNSNQKQYSATSLTGLKVEHSVDKFLEGEATILTLKDKKILDDDEEDVLVNLNLLDNEKHAKNVENKRKGADYQAYDDGEFDEFGLPRMQPLLGKYDEVIEGENKRSFKIGVDGEIDDEEARYRQMVKKELESKTVSLAMPQLKIATEYRTVEEEAEKFAKRKRKVKKTKSHLTADDLLKDMVDEEGKDRGSRGANGPKKERFRGNESEEEITPGGWMSKPVKLEDDVKMDTIIKRTNLMAQSTSKKSDAARLIAEKLKKAAKEEENEEGNMKQLVFDNTAEFCRAVSDLNKQEVKVKAEPESLKSHLDRELEEFALRESSDDDDDDDISNSGWDKVERDKRTIGEQMGGQGSKLKSVLEEEPEVNSGVVGALLLAKHKGYLEKDGGKRSIGPITQATSKIMPEYAIEDKSAKHIEDKWSRKEDRDRGSLREFRDDGSYKPSFNLEYYDGLGRKLNEKEAFRDLSHKFHGKGSGKLKTFKRMKKLEEERKLKGMASDDTPLHMVATMRDKQRSLGSAHIVLSGMGQNLASSGTDFKK